MKWRQRRRFAKAMRRVERQAQLSVAAMEILKRAADGCG